jgi:D-lactate dehydrogenase
MTFRAAGSSLSRQSISYGLLVEVGRHWKDASVETGGRQIRLQPGVIGARANQLLAPYGAKIGPDPASIATSTIGGIVSNNSSGMCRGVDQNAYQRSRRCGSCCFPAASSTRLSPMPMKVPCA